MSENDTGKPVAAKGGVKRRGLLRGAAAAAGVAAGSGAIKGFPTIWAQSLKDVKLLHLGSSYSAIVDIARQASKDLGFTVEMQNSAGDQLVNRVATQPDSLDIADLEFWAVQRIYPRGVMQPIDTKKIKEWNNIVPIFTKGEYPDGKKVSTQGTLPYEVQFVEGDAAKFHSGASDFASMIPAIYNADTLGIRPDLVGRPIESWKELFSPEFKGKTALVDIPSIGIMDAAMALESRGDIQYGDKGNMTKEEIDKTIAALIELKKGGHFRSFWNSFDQSVNLMASGEVVIQS